MARDCVKRIVEQSNSLFTEDEAKRLLKEVDDFAKNKFAKGIDKNDAVQEALKLRAETALKNLKKEKENLARNILVRKEQIDKINSMVENGLGFSDIKYALMTGVNAQYSQGRFSFEGIAESIRRDTLSKFVADLDEANVLDIVASNKFDDVIEKELFALNDNVRKEPVTGSKEAFQAAQIIRSHQEALRKQLNFYGADIGKLDNYTTYRTHDPIKMQKGGEDEWVQFVLGNDLDFAKSFGGDVDDMESVLRDAYNALVTGVRLDSVKSEKELFRFKGPGSLAKKLSHQRQLHFKTAEAEAAYRKKYGRGDNFKDDLFAGLENNALNLAAMKVFGSNPEAMIEKIYEDLGKKYRNKKGKKNQNFVKNFESEKKNALNLYKDIMGHFSRADNVKLAQFGVVLRTIENFKLGGATIAAAFGDPFIKALSYNYNGRNIITSTAKSFKDSFEALSPENKKRFAYITSVGMDSYIGDGVGRFTLEENLSSTAMKVQRLYFKLNLMTQWTVRNERAYARTLAADLAYDKGKKFSDIVNNEVLSTYGIGENEWMVYQKAIEKVGNYELVSPQKIETLSDNIITEYKKNTGSTKSLTQLRFELKLKLQTYFGDQTSFAVLRGGARERQFWLGGTQAGTAMGEFRRLIAQFKQFPTAVASKVWGRAIHGRKGVDVGAIMYLLAMAPVLGYLQGAVKDIVAGKEPKDPSKPETILDAFSRGGGLSILGETIMDFARQDAKQALFRAAGPGIGDIGLFIDAITGDKNAAGRLATSVTPNLFYTNLATQYLFAHHIKETLNPGYLRRTERRMKKYYNQEFFMKPK